MAPMLQCLIGLVLTCLVGCRASEINVTFSDRDARIYNGYTNKNGYPWLMFLAYYKGEGRASQFCGATLIEKSWVMTAAHCVVDEDIRNFIVAYGQTDFDKGTFSGSYISKMVIHPSFQKSSTLHTGMDVALLQLYKPITIKPVKLNRGPRLEEPGKQLKVSGWGLTYHPLSGEKGEDVNARVLQEAVVTVLEDEECEKRHITNVEDYICAGSPKGDTDTCAGDSGGPLHKTNSTHACQVGIVSYGQKYTCNPDFGYKRATGFQTVSAVLDWIRKYAKDSGSCV